MINHEFSLQNNNKQIGAVEKSHSQLWFWAAMIRNKLGEILLGRL